MYHLQRSPGTFGTRVNQCPLLISGSRGYTDQGSNHGIVRNAIHAADRRRHLPCLAGKETAAGAAPTYVAEPPRGSRCLRGFLENLTFSPSCTCRGSPADVN